MHHGVDGIAIIAIAYGTAIVGLVALFIAQQGTASGSAAQGLGKITVNFGGFLGKLQRSGIISLTEEHGGQVIVGVGVFGIQGDGKSIAFFAGFAVSQPLITQAHIGIQGGIGANGNSGVVGFDGLLVKTHIVQAQADKHGYGPQVGASVALLAQLFQLTEGSGRFVIVIVMDGVIEDLLQLFIPFKGALDMFGVGLLIGSLFVENLMLAGLDHTHHSGCNDQSAFDDIRSFQIFLHKALVGEQCAGAQNHQAVEDVF